MKRIERHQLKQDQFVSSLQQTLDRVEENRKQIVIVAVVLLAIVAIVGGYTWWRQQVNAKAAVLFAEAQSIAEAPLAAEAGPEGTPAQAGYPNERSRLEAALPKYRAAADAYPATKSGLAARYQAAATLMALGRPDEAAAQYQQVIDKAGDGIYGRMSRLGLAEVRQREGKYDEAIAMFKELAATAKADLPVDGILMQLGRAQLAAGRPADAQQTFKRITDEFPTSAYAGEARKELEALNPKA
jgi:TolA-binding protein